MAKILIVDDRQDTRLLLKKLVQEHEVVEAENGKQALEALAKEKIDLVLLDWEMPEMNGMETFDQIKKTPLHPPVIMITGHEDLEVAVNFLESGGTGFVTKQNLDAMARKINIALRTAEFKRTLRNKVQQNSPVSPSSAATTAIAHEISNVLDFMAGAIDELTAEIGKNPNMDILTKGIDQIQGLLKKQEK